MIYLVRSIKNSCNSIASKQTNKQTNHDVKRTWIDTLPEKTCRWPTIQEKVLNTTNYQGNAMKITVMYHLTAVRMKLKMKVAQSCPTLCDPIAYTVHGILQARILEWVAVPFSRDLPNPEVKPRSPTLLVDSLPAEPPGKPKYLLEWLFSKRQEITSADKDVKKRQPSCTIGRNVNWCLHYERQYGGSSEY